MDHPSRDSEAPLDELSRSLESMTLLEMSELYRSNEWKSPKPSARKIFWLKYSQRIFSHQSESSLKNEDGFYPIHLVHQSLSHKYFMRTPHFVIQSLVENYPQAVAFKDLNGIFPYTYIFNKWPHVPDAVIESILDVDPKAWFTLYRKIRKPSIFSMIAMKHPEVLKECVRGHSIPLHIAAKLVWAHKKDIFSLMLQQGKSVGVGGAEGLGGLLIKDKRGITPLDYILTCSFTSTYRKPTRQSIGSSKKVDQHPVDWDWLWELLKSSCHEFLGTVSVPPLHCAIELGCSQSVIRLIMEMRPDDIRALDCRGMTPLAVAASKDDVSSQVIDALLKNPYCSYPEASVIFDNNGSLPLHIALENHQRDEKTRWDVFQSIVESSPESIEVPNRNQLYPFMIAAGNDLNSLDIVYVLLRNAPCLVHI